jgi:serine/threonine protein phosphatase 1
MMVAALRGDLYALEDWLRFGGDETLRSWGLSDDTLALPLSDLLAAAGDAVPTAAIDWLDALPLTARSGDYVFVHAGIRPGVPLERQTPEDLTWIREEFLTFEGRLPRRVVHGHTIMGDRPVVTPNRISIDTGAFRSGILTAAVLDPEAPLGQPDFLQTAGEPDRPALVREALLVERIAGRPVSPELQAVFDDFVEGRIDHAEMERRSRRLGAAV